MRGESRKRVVVGLPKIRSSKERGKVGFRPRPSREHEESGFWERGKIAERLVQFFTEKSGRVAQRI